MLRRAQPPISGLTLQSAGRYAACQHSAHHFNIGQILSTRSAPVTLNVTPNAKPHAPFPTSCPFGARVRRAVASGRLVDRLRRRLFCFQQQVLCGCSLHFRITGVVYGAASIFGGYVGFHVATSQLSVLDGIRSHCACNGLDSTDTVRATYLACDVASVARAST